MVLLHSRYDNATPNLCGCSVHYWVSCAIDKGGFLRLHASFSLAAVVPQSKFTELRSSAAVVSQSKSTEI